MLHTRENIKNLVSLVKYIYHIQRQTIEYLIYIMNYYELFSSFTVEAIVLPHSLAPRVNETPLRVMIELSKLCSHTF